MLRRWSEQETEAAGINRLRSREKQDRFDIASNYGARGLAFGTPLSQAQQDYDKQLQLGIDELGLARRQTEAEADAAYNAAYSQAGLTEAQARSEAARRRALGVID